MPNDKCPLCASPNKIVGYFGEGIPVYQLACGSSKEKQSDYCQLIINHRRLIEAAKKVPVPWHNLGPKAKSIKELDCKCWSCELRKLVEA